jgi:ubiquinone/menaquinone biosynthesis C-methylase UbiE
MTQNLKAGDFTGLASDYSQNRPDYSASVLNALLGLLKKPATEIDFADVGAGTGIWSRLVYGKGVRSTIAVEPNEDMRTNGISDSADTNIHWQAGNAEQTGLTDSSFDWLTMASSFHWANFEVATREFHRVLRSGGRFTAIWNPRLIEVNPLLVEIEAHLDTLRPNIKRVSSGRSGITETLTEQLWDSPYFEDVVYLEGRHVIEMTPERYMGAWRSVNDLRVQLGPEKFNEFLLFVEKRISGLNIIETTYLTRAWSARRMENVK